MDKWHPNLQMPGNKKYKHLPKNKTVSDLQTCEFFLQGEQILALLLPFFRQKAVRLLPSTVKYYRSYL